MLYAFPTVGRTDAEKEVDRLYRRVCRLDREWGDLIDRASRPRATEADIQAAVDFEPQVTAAHAAWHAAAEALRATRSGS